MKKTVFIRLTILISVFSLILCSCTRIEDMREDEMCGWDCTVSCEQTSTPDSYIITYSDVIFSADTVLFIIQNQNDFDVKVHLFANRENEEVIDVAAGGVSVLSQLDKEAEYNLGIHADVEEGTQIRVMVYDGDASKRL